MSVRSKFVAGLLGVLLMCPLAAGAHIKNEETQYPDIDFSPARFDIVLLAAAGMIPETPVFEPDRALKRKDLAGWLALSKGAAEGGENPDIDALARAALAAGLIDTLDGEATYGDLDKLFFDGKALSDRASETPSKADAARYLATHLTLELLARRGLTEGPTGAITNIASKPTDDGDMVYILTIGEAVYPMYAHGRVAHGPADLLAWEGRSVARSFVRTINGRQMWTYLDAKPVETRPASAPVQTRDVAPPDSGNDTLLYALIGGVVILAAGLFFRGRRAG